MLFTLWCFLAQQKQRVAHARANTSRFHHDGIAKRAMIQQVTKFKPANGTIFDAWMRIAVALASARQKRNGQGHISLGLAKRDLDRTK